MTLGMDVFRKAIERFYEVVETHIVSTLVTDRVLHLEHSRDRSRTTAVHRSGKRVTFHMKHEERDGGLFLVIAKMTTPPPIPMTWRVV